MRRIRAAGALDYTQRLWVRIWLLLVFIFLYAPIVILVVFSFNDSRRNIVWRGFTTEYYFKALANDSLREAFFNSLLVAGITTVLSTVLGCLLAIALWRFRFPGKAALEGANALPIVIPEICLGVALLIFFSRLGLLAGLGWPFGLLPVIIGHVTFCFPFVTVVIRARLAGFDRALEEASLDLGASEWQTFWRVLVPYLRPALIAGALLAATISLDDFVVTFFTSGPETLTLPVKIYSMVRFGATPEVHAASTVLIAITLLLTFVAMRLQRPPRLG